MHPKELKELIAEGESSRLEFKRKFTNPVKIAKEVTALANTKGGILLVGIDDDGSVVGVYSEKSVIDSVTHCCQFYCDPPIFPDLDVIELHGRDIIVVGIGESEEKPNYVLFDPDDRKTDKQVYIRVGEKSVQASPEMTRVLRAGSSDSTPLRIVIGQIEKRLFLYLDKHERATVKDFQRLCNISKRRAERLLVRLVRAGVLQIHQDSAADYFTLVDQEQISGKCCI